MLLLSFISLVDRSILSILSPTILRELNLTAGQYGTAILVFSICYMLANPIWGLWMDRVGLFWAIGIAVALWSLASGAHAFVSGFMGLCIARGLLGFGEAATFPAGLKTVTETLPAAQRSFGLGLAYSGGSLGALLTPIVITPLALRFGWRSTFVLSAIIGFVWIVGWLLLRRTGLYRPLVTNRAERAKWQWSNLNRNLLATAIIYGLGAAPVAYALYTAPLYLSRVLHLPQSSLGHLLWVPPAGWEAGYLFWGRLADSRRRKATLNATKAPSPLTLFALFAAGSVLLAAIPWCARLSYAIPLTMVLFFFVMFLSGGYIVISLAHGATTQPASNTGLLAGFSISGWSLATGVLMYGVGHMLDHGMYSESFWLVSALPAIGVGLWWLVQKPVPIEAKV